MVAADARFWRSGSHSSFLLLFSSFFCLMFGCVFQTHFRSLDGIALGGKTDFKMSRRE